jgi:hypothetical protein
MTQGKYLQLTHQFHCQKRYLKINDEYLKFNINETEELLKEILPNKFIK